MGVVWDMCLDVVMQLQKRGEPFVACSARGYSTDLASVEARLRAHKYAAIGDVESDVRTLWREARARGAPGCLLHAVVRDLEGAFDVAWKRVVARASGVPRVQRRPQRPFVKRPRLSKLIGELSANDAAMVELLIIVRAHVPDMQINDGDGVQFDLNALSDACLFDMYRFARARCGIRRRARPTLPPVAPRPSPLRQPPSPVLTPLSASTGTETLTRFDWNVLMHSESSESSEDAALMRFKQEVARRNAFEEQRRIALLMRAHAEQERMDAALRAEAEARAQEERMREEHIAAMRREQEQMRADWEEGRVIDDL